jgi:hypothetical protein
MSLLMELHEAKKARTARIAAAAQRHQAKHAPVLMLVEVRTEDELIEALEPEPEQPSEPVLILAPRPLRILSIEGEPQEPKERWYRVEDIIRAVRFRTGVTTRDLLSARRTANVVLPRQIAMYIAKTLTIKSLPEIGRRFGGRDHTTVLHAVRKVRALMEAQPEVNFLVNQILRDLETAVIPELTAVWSTPQ